MIYRLSYYFIYQIVKKRNPAPMFYSAGVVTFMQIVHFLMPFVILKKFFGVSILPIFSSIYLINKLFVMPLLLVWLLLVHFWFKKYFNNIATQFSGKKVITLKNGLIVFGLIVVPLVISILLSIKW